MLASDDLDIYWYRHSVLPITIFSVKDLVFILPSGDSFSPLWLSKLYWDWDSGFKKAGAGDRSLAE